MTDMVERVARASFEADWPKDNWERFGKSDHAVERYRRIARAAIASMMEPTPDQLAEGMDAYARHEDAEQDVHGIYQAMINAALNDGGSE